ncbi:MAG: hypothetical protein LBG64_02470 [Pseudomonadales bacterium]|jgi:hypothetical protein|nr:hypothetical protein [Pseudomonadales bacterium]
MDDKKKVSGDAMRDQKRTMNLLAGLCAVLFGVCFVLGLGLIRNQDRIENLEERTRLLADNARLLREYLEIVDGDNQRLNTLVSAVLELTSPPHQLQVLLRRQHLRQYL